MSERMWLSEELERARTERDLLRARLDVAAAEEREACARIIDDNMLCGDKIEVLHPRSRNPGNKVGLAYASAIRARAALAEIDVGKPTEDGK